MRPYASWILCALALFLAPQATAQYFSSSTAGDWSLLKLIDGAELIAVGTVVPRHGDPAELGWARQALTIDLVLKGEPSDGEVGLIGSSGPVFDDDTGEFRGYTASLHSVSWSNGNRVLVFLNPSEANSRAWSASLPGGRRSPFPGDFELYTEKLRAAVDLLAQSRTVKQRDALREWALSLLDHEATLADGVRVLLDSKQERRGDSRLGSLSPEQEARVVQAVMRFIAPSRRGFGSTSRMALRLIEDIPAREIDSLLAYLVSGDTQLAPRQRSEYAMLIAKRLDDKALSEAAAELEAHVALGDKVIDDPELRGAWEIKWQALCMNFRDPAYTAISRAPSRASSR